MALIPKPRFPNVPKLPGVPQLPRSLQFPSAPPLGVQLGLALGALWQAVFAQTLWGIYKANKPKKASETADGIDEVTVVGTRTPVVVPDSFGEFTYDNESTISDFPVEQGQFASYNKVANPFDVVIRFYKGGTKEARKRFLDSLDAIAGTLELYDIVTPEKTYLNVNVTRRRLVRRGERGAFFFAEVDVFFREIRQVTSTYTATATTTENAKNPSAASVANVGVVQTTPFPFSGLSIGL